VTGPDPLSPVHRPGAVLGDRIAGGEKSIGRIVGRINEHPAVAAGRILMMGPAGGGASNIELGVNVSYADINNTAVLVEMARGGGGAGPEVSYGTHFFLDLVEAQIIYLPVYPNDPEAEFNGAMFKCLPNVLTALLPDANGLWRASASSTCRRRRAGASPG